jgi:DMSO/TMAO reductase YedYZ molybdopterin-dependent catalytic subunit
MTTTPSSRYDAHRIEHMRHHLTLLAYEWTGKPLNVLHGAPLRLINELGLGFKQVKWIQAVEFLETFTHLGGRAVIMRTTTSSAIARASEPGASRACVCLGVTSPRLKPGACPPSRGASRASAPGDLVGSLSRSAKPPRRRVPVGDAPPPPRVGPQANISQDAPGDGPAGRCSGLPECLRTGAAYHQRGGDASSHRLKPGAPAPLFMWGSRASV